MRQTFSRLAVSAALAMGLAESAAEAAVTIYVDDDAPPGGNGSSWASAFSQLRGALPVAVAGDEVRVAQGVYKASAGHDRWATFSVKHIAVRGGYAGLGAPDPDARDFDLYRTVLSGDLVGDDGPPGSFENYGDNSFHIMTVSDIDGSTMIEGLVITASETEWVTPTSGGAIRAYGGSPCITHCVFLHNRAYAGGAIDLFKSRARIQYCKFEMNRAQGVAAGGGALRVYYSNIDVQDCSFEENSPSGFHAGAIAGSGTFVRCKFKSNRATDGGGAVYGGGTFVECDFFDNSSKYPSGALHGEGPGNHGVLVNCRFIDNRSYTYGGGAVTGRWIIIGCTFINNWTYEGGGAGFRGSGLLFNCEFRGNQRGGGAMLTSESIVVNCVFNGNDSTYSAGAVAVSPGIYAHFANCTFTNNLTTIGHFGALSGGGVILNSILWNNFPGQLGGGFDVRSSCVQDGWPGPGNISADPQFIDPLGPDGIAGTDDDDLRLSANSPCLDAGDNALLPADALDLDEDGQIFELLPVDIAFRRRIVNGIVDQGAYEWQRACEPDIHPSIPGPGGAGNNLVNTDDLLAVISGWGACDQCAADITGDGAVNIDDVLAVIVAWGECP